MNTLADYEATMWAHMLNCECEGDLWKHDARMKVEIPRNVPNVVHWPKLRLV